MLSGYRHRSGPDRSDQNATPPGRTTGGGENSRRPASGGGGPHAPPRSGITMAEEAGEGPGEAGAEGRERENPVMRGCGPVMQVRSKFCGAAPPSAGRGEVGAGCGRYFPVVIGGGWIPAEFPVEGRNCHRRRVCCLGTDIAAVRTAPIRTQRPPAEQRGAAKIADGRHPAEAALTRRPALESRWRRRRGEGPAKPGRRAESAKNPIAVAPNTWLLSQYAGRRRLRRGGPVSSPPDQWRLDSRRISDEAEICRPDTGRVSASGVCRAPAGPEPARRGTAASTGLTTPRPPAGTGCLQHPICQGPPQPQPYR